MEPGGDQKTLLIVDDDRGLLRLIGKVLNREGFAIHTAESGESALAWLREHHADLMLLDLKLQDLEGAELVRRLTEATRCPPFIIITGQGDERVAVDMMKRGARDYLVKDGDFLQFVPAVVKQVLEQLEKERRLVEAEEQVHLIRSVVDQGYSAVLITDSASPEPNIIYINPAFALATGYAPGKVIGRPLSALARLVGVQARLRSGLAEGASVAEEVFSYQTPQGERWGQWRLGPVRDKHGKTTNWLIIFQDITESKRLEKEILEISDQERRRIGQDLHDGLCQHLAGIELMCQVLGQKLLAKSKPEAARVGEIGEYVREAISQTRSLARGLSPVTLESEGLVSALHELAASSENMFGVSCRVECLADTFLQPPAVATHLYRIAQESVSNAIKHGKAREVVIKLESSPGGTRLSVADNGGGFPDVLAGSGGMGLRIMRYRAGMIGGTFSIEKNPGGGALIVCSMPAPSAASGTGSWLI